MAPWWCCLNLNSPCLDTLVKEEGRFFGRYFGSFCPNDTVTTSDTILILSSTLHIPGRGTVVPVLPESLMWKRLHEHTRAGLPSLSVLPGFKGLSALPPCVCVCGGGGEGAGGRGGDALYAPSFGPREASSP